MDDLEPFFIHGLQKELYLPWKMLNKTLRLFLKKQGLPLSIQLSGKDGTLFIEGTLNILGEKFLFRTQITPKITVAIEPKQASLFLQIHDLYFHSEKEDASTAPKISLEELAAFIPNTFSNVVEISESLCTIHLLKLPFLGHYHLPKVLLWALCSQLQHVTATLHTKYIVLN